MPFSFYHQFIQKEKMSAVTATSRAKMQYVRFGNTGMSVSLFDTTTMSTRIYTKQFVF
jgi:hypothetical protein